MAPAKAVFTRETFQFFKDLARHNHKEWMDAHRDRYQTALVQPFRRLLEELVRRDRSTDVLSREETKPPPKDR